MKFIILAALLAITGCSSEITDKKICMRFDGGSPLHGALLRDEWGQGGYYQVMDDRFWEHKYTQGTWVEFEIKRRMMNSGNWTVEAVKYSGECKDKNHERS